MRVPGPNGKRQQEMRTFGTTAVEPLALRDWLEAHAITHVAITQGDPAPSGFPV